MIDEILLMIAVLSFTIGLLFFTLKLAMPKDRPLIAAVALMIGLIITDLITVNASLQLLILVSVIIIILYIVLGEIYPRIYSDADNIFFEGRKETVWAEKNKMEAEIKEEPTTEKESSSKK